MTAPFVKLRRRLAPTARLAVLAALCLASARIADAMPQEGELLWLPTPADVAAVEPGVSPMRWYTERELLELLPRFFPVSGGAYLTKAIQRGTFVLKDGRRLNWEAGSKTSLLLIDGGREQFFALPGGPEARTQEDETPLYPIVEGGKVGYIDPEGRVRIPPQFKMELQEFVDTRYRYITAVRYFSEGLAGAIEERGYIDRSGKLVIPGVNPLDPFRDGRAWVSADCQPRLGCRYGFIDRTGRFLVRTDHFQAVYKFSHGLAAFQKGDRWGFMEMNGREVVPARFYKLVTTRGGNIALLGGAGVQGSIVDDESRQLHLPEGADGIGMPSEGLAAVRIRGKWGFMDTRSGALRIAPRFDDEEEDSRDSIPQPFKEGMAAVRLEGKWGWIDRRGEFLIEPLYEKVEPFAEGYAMVRAGGKWGAIDRTGRVVTPPQFDDPAVPWRFSREGVAAASAGGKYGYIDRSGRVVVDLKYDGAADFGSGLGAVKVGKKWGFIDLTGRMVIEPKFDNEGGFRGPLGKVIIEKLNGLTEHFRGSQDTWGYINRAGVFVWKFKDLRR